MSLFSSLVASISGTSSVSVISLSSLVSILMKGSNRNLLDDVFPTLFAIRGRLRAERGVLETGSVCMSEILILFLIDESGAALITVSSKSSSQGLGFFFPAFLFGFFRWLRRNCVKLYTFFSLPSSSPMDNLAAIYASKFPKPHIDRIL